VILPKDVRRRLERFVMRERHPIDGAGPKCGKAGGDNSTAGSNTRSLGTDGVKDAAAGMTVIDEDSGAAGSLSEPADSTGESLVSAAVFAGDVSKPKSFRTFL